MLSTAGFGRIGAADSQGEESPVKRQVSVIQEWSGPARQPLKKSYSTQNTRRAGEAGHQAYAIE